MSISGSELSDRIAALATEWNGCSARTLLAQITDAVREFDPSALEPAPGETDHEAVSPGLTLPEPFVNANLHGQLYTSDTMTATYQGYQFTLQMADLPRAPLDRQRIAYLSVRHLAADATVYHFADGREQVAPTTPDARRFVDWLLFGAGDLDTTPSTLTE